MHTGAIGYIGLKPLLSHILHVVCVEPSYSNKLNLAFIV